MLSNLSGWHALVILTIVLLVFGSAKLPALAKSFGESLRILKDEASLKDEARLKDEAHPRATAPEGDLATARGVDAHDTRRLS